MNVVLFNGRVKTGHFGIRPGKDIAEFSVEFVVFLNFLLIARGSESDEFGGASWGNDVNLDDG